jgi:hypothetical protein
VRLAGLVLPDVAGRQARFAADQALDARPLALSSGKTLRQDKAQARAGA